MQFLLARANLYQTGAQDQWFLAQTALQTSFVDFIKEQAHCSFYKRLHFCPYLTVQWQSKIVDPSGGLVSIKFYQFTWTKGPYELLPSLGVRRLLSFVCCLSSVNFSHFKLLLQNHWANWNQTQQECSLDGPLQSYCFSFQSDIQHGCQGQ